MNDYGQSLTDAMTMLAQQDNAIFVGQSVLYGGQKMFNTLDGVPMDKRIEFPVAEDLQLGFCIGLAMQGYLPICIYPRIDFLILAMNQLVNHLDIMEPMPKIIIRTAVGAKNPLDAGPQHSKNHIEGLRAMTNNIPVLDVVSGNWPVPYHAYEYALCGEKRPSIVVEYAEKY